MQTAWCCSAPGRHNETSREGEKAGSLPPTLHEVDLLPILRRGEDDVPYEFVTGGPRPADTEANAEGATAELLEHVRALVRGQIRLELLLDRLSSRSERRCGDGLSAEVDEDLPQETSGHSRPKCDPGGSRNSGLFAPQSPGGSDDLVHGRRGWFQSIRMRPELQRDTEQSVEDVARKLSVENAKSKVDIETSRRAGGSGHDRARLVLSPTSNLRGVIDMLSLVVLMYDMVTVPYFIALPSDADVFTQLAYVSLVYWIVDMFVNFRTGFFHQGELEMKPSAIRRHYFFHGFPLDFLVVFVDAVTLLLKYLEQDSGAASTKLLRVFKFGRFIRLTNAVRLRRVVVVMDRFAERRSSALFRIVFFVMETCGFLLIIVFINHVIACIWLYLARELGEYSDTGITWMEQTTGDQAYSSYGEGYMYLTALHFAMTQMTPGSMQVFPQNSMERVFNVMCLTAGLLIFSTLISSISARVTSFRIQSQSDRSKMDSLNAFLRRHSVSPELRMSIRKHVEVQLFRRRPPVLKDLAGLDKLSLSLRNALQLELCNPYLLEHPYFCFLFQADQSSWEEICRDCVDFSLLMPSDTLFIAGVQALAMYFVVMGEMSYTLDQLLSDSEEEEVVSPAGVRQGAWLSEAAIWCCWKHVGCAEVLGASPCEVLSLNAQRLLRPLTSDPSLATVTWAYARSFHTSIVSSGPPLCSQPTDLELPFDADEAIACMPKEAALLVGQGAVSMLRQPPEALLAGWLHAVREDNCTQLIEEVNKGGCTLLVTKSKGVVRCVRLVAMQLTRADGRTFVRVRLSEKADGSQEATCKLPGRKQQVGEHPGECLKAMLGEKLRPLADCLELKGYDRQREWNNSRRLGVPTNYIRTVISAEWPQGADMSLDAFLAPTLGRRPTAPGSCGNTAGQKDTDRASTPRAADRAASQVDYTDAEVYSFPDGDLYTWVTSEEHDFFNTGRGQRCLMHWLAGAQEAVRRGNSTGNDLRC